MKAVEAQCRADLDELGVDWKPAPRTRKVANPILVPSMVLGGIKLTPIFRKPPFVMDCHLARAIVRTAPLFREAGIAELRFSSIHVYRRVRLRGRTLRALSRHSLGLAIDVYEVVLDDGQTLVVEHDFGQGEGMRFIPLHVSLIASGQFRAVLSPGNDRRSHRDHFHLEARMLIPDPVRPERRKSLARRARPPNARRGRP
jgi:hypothetical protein